MWKGDLRSKGNGPYVLMPLDTYETLTDVYEGVVGFRRPREFELIPEEEEMTVEEQHAQLLRDIDKISGVHPLQRGRVGDP